MLHRKYKLIIKKNPENRDGEIMVLGFYYHIVLYERKGEIRIPSFLGVFIDSLATEVSSLIIFGHQARTQEAPICDYTLKRKNIEWVNLGFKTPYWDRVLFPGKTLRNIRNEISKCDFTIVRAPSPLAPYFYLKFRRQTKISFLMVGDYIEGIKNQKEKIYRKIPVFILTYLNEYLQNKAIKNCTTFVNSRLLFNKYLPFAYKLHEVRTTTISKEDFYARRDSFNVSSAEINLLFTGRITIAKGVLEIVQVASKLIKEGKNVKVHFVGWEDNPDKLIEKEIIKLAARLEMPDSIFFHGKKSVGQELFEMYRMSQIFVLPSQSDSEGFPRTIWEAMANSIPVVATKVGSIPHFVEDEKHALLIMPKDQAALYSAIKRLITDAYLRQSIIANAFTFAKEITLEVQTSKLLNILQSSEM